MTPRKLFYIMIGALLFTGLLTLGGIYLADQYLSSESKAISVMKAEDELIGTELISAQRTRDNLEDYSYLDQVTEEILPDSKNQSEVILLINTIGAETGIKTESFTFLGTDGQPSEKSQTEPLEGTSSILVFPVNIKFKTTYGQLINWLDKAEENQRKMQVSQISITKSSEEGEENLLDVTMLINAYLER